LKIVHSEELIAKGDFPKSADWAAESGVREIPVVEHDRTDPNVARIPKGTDGRAIT